jgi:hypothetical protein
MLAHVRRALPLIAIVVGLGLPVLVSSCDKVPLLAPTGTVINLFATSNSVSLNSQVDIIATAIENGTDVGSGSGTTSSAGAGTPVQNGTVISFTTTIGSIEPAEARTHNGQVTVKLLTGGQSGTATVTAYSGGASKSLQLKVGTAAANRISITASPQTLGANGGTSTISATVTDEGGAPVAGIPVSFSTDAGTLASPTVTTNGSGTATTTLTTSGTATVTANAGSATAATIKVNVGTRALSAFSVSPQSPTVGQPVTFTITPASGANISGGTLNFGDGSSAPVSPIGGTITHAYESPGQYTATVTVNSATSGAETYSTTVSVGGLPVTLAASPTTPTAGAAVTFTVNGVTSAQVSRYDWRTSDGQTASTSGPSWQTTFAGTGPKQITVTLIGVNGGTLGSASTTITVQ